MCDRQRPLACTMMWNGPSFPTLPSPLVPRGVRTVPPSERVYVVPFGLISVGVSGFAGLVSSVTRESEHPFAAIHSTKRLGEALHVNS